MPNNSKGSKMTRSSRSNNKTTRAKNRSNKRENINRDLTQSESIRLAIIILLIILGFIFLGWFLTLILCLGFGLIYGTIKKLTNLKNKKKNT